MTRDDLTKALPLRGKSKNAQFFWAAYDDLATNDPVHPILTSRIDAETFIRNLIIPEECICPDYICINNWRNAIFKARWNAWKELKKNKQNVQ